MVRHARHPRFLLLQVRKPEDPMRRQEVQCFARMLHCPIGQIQTADLLHEAITAEFCDRADIFLLGGSGDYSAAGEGDWLERVLDGLCRLCDFARPTFASCWGFQAIARALGGRCVHDPAHSELGSIKLVLTERGRADPLFCQLPTPFLGQAGHEDHVVELPPDATLLASSESVPQQAFRLEDRPIYCTQFHPELDRAALLERLHAYPRYVEKIAGVSLAEFQDKCRETPEANTLLARFVELVWSDT